MNKIMTLLALIAVTGMATAGGSACTSINTGNWSDVATWNCTTVSGLPESDSTVTVNNTHTVLLDISSTIGSLVVFAGGDVDMGAAGGPVNLVIQQPGSDLTQANTDLFGDVVITALADVSMGGINNGFSLGFDGTGLVTLAGLVGDSEALVALDSGADVDLLIANDVTTVTNQSFLGDVFIDGTVALSASDLGINGPLNASLAALSSDLTLNHSGNANITDQVGAVTPLTSLTANAAVTVNVAGGATINTTGAQIYNQLNIDSDVTLVNASNSQIRINGSSGAHALVVNSAGTTQFAGTIGLTPHTAITTDAVGQTRLSGPVNINTNGAGPITFNDQIALGPSANAVVNQAGSADVIFNAPIFSSSGSPHRLTINDDSGRTVFNDTVRVGELTTNDGAGDDVTVINTTSFNTQSSGANNGFMRFFDPVEVMQSVSIEEENGGRIQFYNTLNESLGAGAVAITLISDAEVRLGPVGNLNSPSSLTSDSGGTVAINGDVFVNANLTFNDSVSLIGDFTLSGENVYFNDTVDLQTHDLTLFALGAEANGVISGSGNLISDVISNLALNAENDYTGQTIINNGILNLEDAPSDNNISSSSQIVLSEFGVINPNDTSFIFRLADGQTLSGDGSVNQLLLADDGSMVSPGASPGSLSAQTFLMNTGSQLNIEINGAVPETDYDQVATTLADLNADALGGGDLVVQLNFTADPSDEFIIISNPTAEAVLGTFNGLPEGSYVSASNGQSLAVSYVGGDGNDVVLSGACTPNISVTDGADSGVGTLRKAVADVCPGGTIDFATDMTVNLTSSIDINKDMIISGDGANVTISGGNNTLLMGIFSGAEVTISHANLNNGSAGKGSGALYVEGQLSLISTTLNNNVGNEGGAIYVVSGGDLVIVNSTLVGNSADHGGAIYNLGSTTIVNSTFTNNGTSGTIEGGAIHNQGTLVSTNNTLANNGTGSTSGAAVFTQNGSHELINTLIADNNAAGCFIDLGNSIEKNSSSLIESGNCDADLTADPQLQTLADNGGDTLTIALALTSPAVDSANITFCPLTDQRGVDRPQLEGCDIGAYETEYLPIVYVDRDNTTRSGICIPGACWANAYEHLSDALAVAGPTSQVWVADGVYYPDQGAGAINDDPQGSFDITSGVLLYGGFNGSETALNQRDVNANVTILSGDIDQNDTDDDGNQVAELVADINGTNAYNVLSINGAGVIIDGFTITAGYADGGTASEQSGAGLRCLQAESMTHVLANNSWMGNYAASNGGAIHVCGGLVLESFFGGNASDANGGAIFSSNNVLIENTGFYANQANFSGGAVFAASTTIDRVVFSGNQANSFGGALFINGDIDISNSLFSGNYSNDSGGAVITFNNTHFTNVTMTGNQAFVAGGAVFIPDAPNRPTGGAEFTFSNSIIWNNQDATGPGTLAAGVTSTDSVSFAHSIFQGSGGSTNWNSGAGIDAGNNIDMDPEFVLEVDLMTVPTVAGNARLALGSAAIGSGDNAAVSRPLDLDNNPRIDGGVVDMGAYEYGDLIFASGFE